MKKFKDWLLNNFVSIIGILSPVAGGIAVAVWNSIGKKFSILDWILIGVLAAESIFFIWFALWRKISYKSYHYVAGRIRPDYVTLHKEIIYKIIKTPSSSHLEYSCLRQIKCCVDHLERIPAKFIWTGDGEPTFLLNYKGNVFTDQPQKKGIWRFFDINFDHCIVKGDTHDVDIIFNPIKDFLSSSPFVSTSTDEPNKSIIFKIDLGDEYANKKANFEVYRANESYYPLDRMNLNFDRLGRIEFTVPHPKRFRRYVISWDWIIPKS